MQIRVNQQNLDFTLELEKTVGEVYRELSQWLDTSGYVITRVLGDDREYNLDHKAGWEGTPLNDVSVLEVTAQSPVESMLSMYNVLFDYLELLEGTVRNDDREGIQDVIREYENIHSSLEQLFGKDVALLDAALRESGLTGESINPDYIPQLLTVIAQLKTILHDRIRELNEPVREIVTAARLLKSTIGDITDVSVLLQTGKDREAMGVVITFSELAQKITRLYPILKNTGSMNFSELTVNSVSFEDFYLSLNEILHELIEAFEAKDSVLIGDLLEYEIAPRLESLIEVLEGSNKDEA